MVKIYLIADWNAWRAIEQNARKRTREGSSQTDEEDESDHYHKQGCKKCFETTNSRLSGIEEKLEMLLAILPEMETYNKRITLLEEELEEANKAPQTSLENSQTEIEELKAIVRDVNFKQRAASTSSDGIESELKELHRWHVKLECHSSRGNMKFFEINERENETNNDTDLTLGEFMRTHSLHSLMPFTPSWHVGQQRIPSTSGGPLSWTWCPPRSSPSPLFPSQLSVSMWS